MALFIAQGRSKLPLSSDGVHCKLLCNAFGSGSRSFKLLHKGKFGLFGRLYASTLSGVSGRFYAKASYNASEEDMSDDSDDEFENDDLACFRGLVLDIAYRPVNVVCWKRAICLEFMEKADVLEYYDQTVKSPSGSFYIPAVLRVPNLLQVFKRRRIKSNLSRKNVLYRDNYTCQYCYARENLTIDHVLPVARGGEWTWENLAPKDYEILAIPLTSSALRMLRRRNGTPEEWRQYLLSE